MWHRTLPSGQNILDDLKHFAPYGLPIQITEYDTDARFSDEDDARFLDEFLTAWFSHPLTDGFIMWGFQDALIWNGNAPLFRDDWSLKPSGKVWMDLVFGKWWTEETGRTGEDGVFDIRGFLGTYDVEVRHGGLRAVRTVELPKEGEKITVRFDASSEKEDSATHLASSNPYRTGKLPAHLTPKEQAGASTSRTVSAKEGDGAWAMVASSQGQDFFLRFDTGELARDSVAKAVLTFQASEALPGPIRVQFYILSHRFVPQGREAGLDWKPVDLAAGRTPGRDRETGEYRLGDAAVIYLGEQTLEKIQPGTPIRFSAPELARALQASSSKGVTVIISPIGSGLKLAGPEDATRQPTLELKLRKP